MPEQDENENGRLHPRSAPYVAKATATVVKQISSDQRLLDAVEELIQSITKNDGLAERAGGLNDDEVDRLCRVRRLMILVAKERGLSLL